MTTNNESPRVNPTNSLFKFVSKKFNAIDQENNSSSSHSLFPCIYKVPDELRKLNKWAYDPRVVSIGPIHNNRKKKKDDDNDNDDDDDDDDDREEQHLKATEHIKVAYTKELLCRVAGKLASTVKKEDSMSDAVLDCSEAMIDFEASALNCYAENLKPIIKQKIHQHRLAEMLLIDGCFILELLYRSYLVKTENRIIKDDPLFGKTVIMSGIRHDLLLLENQLPFFILKKLFSKTIKTIPVLDHPESSCPSLTELVLSFFGNVMNFNNDHIQSTTTNLKKGKCFHILHLIHSCYQPSSPIPDKKEDDCFHILIHSCDQPSSASPDPNLSSPSPDPKPSHFSHRASDLICAGVKFEPGKAKHQLDVHFEEAPGLLRWCRSAKFQIPPLSIYDSTEPFLRNLIAFEQCCPYINSRHITSYAFLMDSLIDSAADVELLEKAHIINNYLGASEDASVLFNNICKHAVLGPFHFAKPCDDAESHCRRRWPRFRTSLMRDYFSNPWSGIAVLAASILFAITVVQTVYTLLAYYGV